MSEPLPAELTPSDRLMWRIERDPVLRSPVVAVGLLDLEPDQRAVHETWARAAARFPRLRQRVTSSGPFGRSLRWTDDPAFSLDYHVRRVRAPAGQDLRAVLDLAAPGATAALDPARPLWECTVVEGVAGGRAAFVLKFHHTITDGVGGIDLAGSVFDDRRSGGSPEPEAPEPEPGPSLLQRRLEQAVGLVGTGIAGVRNAGTLAAGAARLGRSVGRLLEPAPEPLSPLWLARGLDRRLDVLELPLDELRRAARAKEATVNELFLAALAGGLHDLHARLGRSVSALRVTMPVSVRRPGDPPGGNRFTPVRFVLPVDDPDPVHRLRVVGAITRRWRGEPALALTEVLARGLDLLPDGVVTPLFGSMLRNVDVDAVDVPGLTAPAYLGGAEIQRLWAFAPPTGAAVSVTLLSHLDTACIGILADLAAVEDPELLTTCLQRSFEEASHLGTVRPLPDRRWSDHPAEGAAS